ncbi:Cupin domain protein [Rubripirellula lacrimiformis]|uniref:Cupin domain protein n=1 Tax=Rubripirellula lacrimiformis TaxID=1930273 RepID=A0A517NE15_9BACT|nr:cupin domain-containing protein [Rubripirellula lacrimiformis]QDT05374.1 Cupin domain protein [Rubripirellula lacrimiformis]
MDIPQVTSNADAQSGQMGQRYLASGKSVALRRWEMDACEFNHSVCREYETVGLVISGELALDLDGEIVHLHPGDSWLVPEGAPHRYRVVEPVVVIEATSPPARFNDRDEPA